ncbi:MAG: GNAT family N-acetyltransferase [Candidatus Thorarchaeota archaeon]
MEPTGPSTRGSAYLIMRAKTTEALKLARESWSQRNLPTYIKVRQLSREDLSAFVDLYNRCFMSAPDPFCPLTMDDAEKLELDGIFVAELGGEPIGFIACFVEESDTGRYGEITAIGVLPSRRRKGVATLLIQQAAEFFVRRGVEEVYCEVYESNLPSRLLITSYGFSEVGRREIPHLPTLEPAREEHDRGRKILKHIRLRPSGSDGRC